VVEVLKRHGKRGGLVGFCGGQKRVWEIDGDNFAGLPC